MRKRQNYGIGEEQKAGCTLSALSIRRSTAEEVRDKSITNYYKLVVKRIYLTNPCQIGKHGGGDGRGQTYKSGAISDLSVLSTAFKREGKEKRKKR